MPKFAANLSMMFNELPFLARFAAAAEAGFNGVEYLFPYEFPADVIAAGLAKCSLANVLFNLPPGNWAAGERGTTCLPGREQELARGRGFSRLLNEVLLSSHDLVENARAIAEKAGDYVAIDNSCDDWGYADAVRYLLNVFHSPRTTHPGCVCFRRAR